MPDRNLVSMMAQHCAQVEEAESWHGIWVFQKWVRRAHEQDILTFHIHFFSVRFPEPA